MYTIAHIRNDYTEKFGVPRQSGLVRDVDSRIIFEPEFRNPEALRGLEGFSHIWIIWEFSEAVRRGSSATQNSAHDTETGKDDAGHEVNAGTQDTQNASHDSKTGKADADSLCEWRPTVRPPRLGGNERMGVFATRSPFRPNPIGLSCVELAGIEEDPEFGPVILVKGADLMNGTPIYDIKPYIPYADCKPTATGGFTDEYGMETVVVDIPDDIALKLGRERTAGLTEVLGQDPRPAYQRQQSRTYTFKYAGYDITFAGEPGKITVTGLNEL